MQTLKPSARMENRGWKGGVSRGPTKIEQMSRQDESQLSRLGKKQVLKVTHVLAGEADGAILLMIVKRRFGMISTLGLSTTLMLTWEGVLVYFGFGLANGGSAGLVTSFILSWFGFLAVMVPLAELASMAPTSSGQYHWVFMLAPHRTRNILSYLTGWLSIAVWQSLVAMGGILSATLIQGLLVLNYPDSYTSKGWHGTLLIWATVLLAFIMNSILGRWLPKIEGFILYLHVFGFFAIIIPLLFLAKRVDATTVFTTWSNDGGWSSVGLAFFVGIITNVGPFIGADGAVHMAEETQNAALVIPWNIVITMVFNGLLGFGMLLTTLFCMGDLDSAMESPLPYPFIQIFYASTLSSTGTNIMVCIVLVLSYAATFGQFAGASRQLWAFARDRGPPFSNWLLLVNPRSLLPLNAVWTTCAISVLLGLINIGSETALQSILSFTVSSWEAAAAIPLSLLLWNRLTGRIRTRSRNSYMSTADTDFPLTWGPWRVPEPFGSIVNVIGLCWIAIAFFFSFWPSSAEVTPATMNFSVLMTGFWFLFGIAYYFAYGRKYYNGPIIETR
ncbi:Uu.00g142630.m01.CDS01 [Anthostomella pinea]|uniref:Uu.00g142630.m01.CDS01 n=1 Tax=Anthostomella pinea TaxID=933095 RepID=A0AAI8VRP8_9PEZI|nr:Uu.00g142630.m01.CDS01 [Anthostomella pinea]